MRRRPGIGSLKQPAPPAIKVECPPPTETSMTSESDDSGTTSDDDEDSDKTQSGNKNFSNVILTIFKNSMDSMEVLVCFTSQSDNKSVQIFAIYVFHSVL